MASGQAGIALFTTPRPFEGLYDVIQTNAWESWKRVGADVQIFGDWDYEGDRACHLAEAYEYAWRPVRERSPRGVPLMSDLFGRAEGDIKCYVNSDIILFDGVLPAIEKAASHFESCLIVARRWNVQVWDHLDFSGDWQGELWDKIQEQGSLMVECAIDLFAWKGNVYVKFAPYAIGRYRWDNWLVGNALARGNPVVDITPACRIVHQSHAQVPWEDPDAQDNFKIQGAFCGAKDSTHTLTKEGELVKGWQG
jgi:hypothetical protein